jgi:hypothetical protein
MHEDFEFTRQAYASQIPCRHIVSHSVSPFPAPDLWAWYQLPSSIKLTHLPKKEKELSHMGAYLRNSAYPFLGGGQATALPANASGQQCQFGVSTILRVIITLLQRRRMRPAAFFLLRPTVSPSEADSECAGSRWPCRRLERSGSCLPLSDCHAISLAGLSFWPNRLAKLNLIRARVGFMPRCRTQISDI